MDPIAAAKADLDRELAEIAANEKKEEVTPPPTPETPKTPEVSGKSVEHMAPIDFTPFADKKEEPAADLTGIDPEDLDTVGKIVSAKVAPMQAQLKQQQINVMVDTFLNSEIGQHFKPYSNKIKEMAQDERASNLTIESMAALAVGPKTIMQIGAEIERQAKGKAQDSKGGAAGVIVKSDSVDGIPDVSTMNAADIEALAQKVIQGNFTK